MKIKQYMLTFEAFVNEFNDLTSDHAVADELHKAHTLQLKYIDSDDENASDNLQSGQEGEETIDILISDETDNHGKPYTGEGPEEMLIDLGHIVQNRKDWINGAPTMKGRKLLTDWHILDAEGNRLDTLSQYLDQEKYMVPLP